MTGITATTTSPAEVKRLFDEYAGILEMYADDQLAMNKRFKTGKRGRETRYALYMEIAREMREIEFTHPEPREIVGEEREAWLKANGYKEAT